MNSSQQNAHGLPLSNQQSQPFSLNIPPWRESLPPRFPSSHISQPHIPPPPLPPRFPPSHISHPPIPPPPIPPAFPPQQYSNNFSPFPTLTFQSGGINPTIHQMVPSCQASYQNTADVDESQWEVDNWLKRRQLSSAMNIEGPNRDIKIYAVREKLNTAIKLVKELENAALTLNVMVKTVTPSEWDEKCVEIEAKKGELSILINELKMSEEDVSLVKEKLRKRSKKRARLKRKADRWKQQKEETKIKSKNLEFQIDKWQKEMQEVVERTKREEELQREADAVLWGVTHKKAEAARHVSLLSSLQELREVRVKRLTAAGKSISDVEQQTFITVIERLKQLWTRQHAEGQLEEQILRGMLSEAEVRQDPAKTYKKLVLQEWQIAIFGPESSLEANPISKDKLIDIRRSWDQFAVVAPTVLATSIPPAWVLPTPPSSDQWHSLLKY